MLNSALVQTPRVCCQEIFDRVVDAMEQRISAHYGIVTRDELPKLGLDPRTLELLLSNLLTHALANCHEHAPRIHLCARVSDGVALFSLADNGVGIPAEAQVSIFQLSQPGQSLADCQKIIEFNGGKIWIKSTPGEGATYYFTLPAVSPDTANFPKDKSLMLP